MRKNHAWLGLGGNLDDPQAAMAKALQAIDADPRTRVVAVSSVYRTPPWGKTDQPDFLNAVAGVETDLSPRDLLDLCLEAEKGLKRVRAERWGPRTIDIDLLLFDDLTINEPGLEVPHPRMTQRAFVLLPLAEIASELKIGGKTAAQFLATLDTKGIDRVSADGGWWRQG
ncbi:MAG: 2-amino-4-hydroxy-6-hydroxymethyldihydropteridine diphosphokinase [Rhizobiaceae bacterium]